MSKSTAFQDWLRERRHRFLVFQSIVVTIAVLLGLLIPALLDLSPTPPPSPPLGYRVLYSDILQGDELIKSGHYEDALEVYEKARRSLHTLSEYQQKNRDVIYEYRDALLVIDNRILVAGTLIAVRSLRNK